MSKEPKFSFPGPLPRSTMLVSPSPNTATREPHRDFNAFCLFFTLPLASTCYIDIAKNDDSSFTKLATLEQCASYLGTYVANVNMPSDWDGKGTLRWWWHVQSINVTFATCSDISLVKSSS
jgi:hypothetical protein